MLAPCVANSSVTTATTGRSDRSIATASAIANDVQEPHVRPLGSDLSGQEVGRRLRTLRIVECHQDVHVARLPTNSHIPYLGTV